MELGLGFQLANFETVEQVNPPDQVLSTVPLFLNRMGKVLGKKRVEGTYPVSILYRDVSDRDGIWIMSV